MKRLGLRAKLLIGMFVILGASIALVAGQAVLLFQQDKSSYVLELNASQAIKIADEVQSNVRHLTEKMRIFADAVSLPVPPGPERTALLVSMLKQYPEFLLLSERQADGTVRNLSLSGALQGLGLSVAGAHAAYLAGGVPFDTVAADRPFLARLSLSPKAASFTIAVRALPRPDGAPPAVLVAECPIDRLYANRGSRLFDIHITDAAGRPLVTFGEAAAAAPAGAAAAPAPSAAASGAPAAGAAADNGALKGLLPENDRTAGTREYLAAGVPMLAGYAPIGNLGLWAVVQIPKARAFDAAHRLVQRSLVLAGAVCLVALGLVFLFSSSITRSLAALTRATEQIGRGQFAVDIRTAGGGEIGALAERFQRMTQELSAREEALKDANRRLVDSEKMSALGQLGAGIAHEVKNPMTSIRGYAQMGLRKVPADHPLREYFDTIDKETARALEILKNLLRFSRQETAEMSRIDLNAVVSETVKLVSHQLSMKKVTIESDLSEEPLEVIGNSNQMEQVLLNLCINAGDAMEKTGGTLGIATDCAGAGNATARIRVTDSGGGIPPEVVSKIFDPFFTTKPVGKGTGLGLSVSYGIVKDHKGEITVKSTVGQGTTFTILIPLAAEAAGARTAVQGEAEKRVRVISLR